jgi:adhesin transport system outer membrane protein
MRKRMPRWWLSCYLISPALATNTAAVINAEQLSAEQELPSLEGRVALPVSKTRRAC